MTLKVKDRQVLDSYKNIVAELQACEMQKCAKDRADEKKPHYEK